MLGLEQLSPGDRNVVARARRLERFLTQPFFTTEQFTGLKGKLVSLKDAWTAANESCAMNSKTTRRARST
jgi:F0F1-type ATP synthase beta subunit